MITMARKGLPKKYAKMGFKKGWREYKKSKRTPTKRRRTTTRRTYTKRGRNSMKTNALVKGLLAGAGATLIKKYVNVPFADDLAVLGVGYFMKDKTLQTIGAVGLGSDLANMAPGGSGGAGYIG